MHMEIVLDYHSVCWVHTNTCTKFHLDPLNRLARVHERYRRTPTNDLIQARPRPLDQWRL